VRVVNDLAGVDEPVRRYFAHALNGEAARGRGTRLSMNGKIRVGRWLDFTSEWESDGRSFAWRARAGLGRFRPLHVLDEYSAGTAQMSVRLFDKLGLVHAAGDDTVRSGAGRTAVEAASWAPMALLPDRGVSWRAESDDLIIASWTLPPEEPEVRLRIDADGAVRSVSVDRWDDGTHGRHGYIPCGAEVRAERRFADLIIASEIVAGWWFGTPRWDPFFEARVLEATII
jgi:hypothetical protein